MDPELAEIIAAWPKLTPAIRADLTAMVRAPGASTDLKHQRSRKLDRQQRPRTTERILHRLDSQRRSSAKD